MTSRKDLSLLRDAMLSLPRPDAVTPQCLDDESLAALAEARLAADARALVLPHLASCRRCSAALASVVRALGDRDVAREIVRVERPVFGRLRGLVVPLAAAALLLVLIRPGRIVDYEQHRAPAILPAATPVPVAPIGSVPAVTELAWHPVPGADRYRVTLFAAGGTVLYETQLADTVTAVPDSIATAPGRRYLWKVEARTGFDRWVASALVEFTIGQPR